MSAEYLTLSATVERTGLSRRELLRRRQAGKFPKPAQLATHVAGEVRMVLFRTTDVDTWLQANRPRALPADPFDY